MAHSRNGRPNRKRSYKSRPAIDKANKRAFHEAAWNQRVCAVCGKGGEYQTHHVIEKQKLRIIGRMDLVWDVRNALRVCDECHNAQTIGYRRINLDALTDDNYEFAWLVLGMEAADYLRARYNGKDARWERLRDMCDGTLEAARDGGSTILAND